MRFTSRGPISSKLPGQRRAGKEGRGVKTGGRRGGRRRARIARLSAPKPVELPPGPPCSQMIHGRLDDPRIEEHGRRVHETEVWGSDEKIRKREGGWKGNGGFRRTSSEPSSSRRRATRTCAPPSAHPHSPNPRPEYSAPQTSTQGPPEAMTRNASQKGKVEEEEDRGGDERKEMKLIVESGRHSSLISMHHRHHTRELGAQRRSLSRTRAITPSRR